MNVVEKILSASAQGQMVRPGDLVTVDVATAVMHDLFFIKVLWREPLKVLHPDRLVIIFDHIVPGNTPEMAEAHQRARDFAQHVGIRRFHDIGIDGGICHQIIADKAYALPGTVLTCTDSHTSSAGAFNCAARGTAQLDMTAAITTGKNWFQVGETIRYEFESAFSEPGAALSMNARRTLCTMATELSAEFAVFEFDEQLRQFLAERGARPYTPVMPDANARYLDVRRIDLGVIEPLVAKPDRVVKNSVPVGDVAGIRIQQAFIGSCANGTLDDLEVAASVVAGHKVAPGVRFIVTPASQAIYLEASRRGYLATLVEAGAIVTNSTCGPCAGVSFGSLAAGETCITASTRNFKGRMGSKDAKIYMASPATVAASALRGEITHPSHFLAM